MSKEKLRFDNLREAMEEVQGRRAADVGGHTWKLTVERYGIAALFVEIASITGRLEQMIWREPMMAVDNMNFDRAYDLLIDMGNYADFLYQAIREIEKERDDLIDEAF